MPDFRMQQQFPMADVINAAQRKGQLDNETTFKQSEMLNNSLGAIQGIGESLYKRRMMMAQALAGAQMYASTPEGQDMLAPKSLTDIHTSPVPLNQTAQGTDDAGNILPAPNPNQGSTPVAMARQQTTKMQPSGVTPQTLVTAMMGESPSNMLTQLFERQKQRQQFGLEQQKQAFTEKMKPIELAQQERLTKALTGVKASQVSVEQANNLRNSIAAEETRKQQAIKDFPELGGTFISGILPVGSNEKETAARATFTAAQKNIENYNRQLYGGTAGGGGGVGKVGVTMQTPSGVSYTITPTP